MNWHVASGKVLFYFLPVVELEICFSQLLQVKVFGVCLIEQFRLPSSLRRCLSFVLFFPRFIVIHFDLENS